MTTFAPCPAAVCATDRPRLAKAPVTATTRPLRFLSIGCSLWFQWWRKPPAPAWPGRQAIALMEIRGSPSMRLAGCARTWFRRLRKFGRQGARRARGGWRPTPLPPAHPPGEVSSARRRVTMAGTQQ
ncbi:hypothetical protein D3C78_1520050 [compost metagenome]